MSLTVDRFSGLNMFLRPDMLLDDFGGSVRADLLSKVIRRYSNRKETTRTHFSGLGLVRLREELLDTLGNAGHCCL